jgi:hypothetical protein
VDNPEDYKHLRISRKVKTSLGELANLIQEAKILEAEIKNQVLYMKKSLMNQVISIS